MAENATKQEPTIQEIESMRRVGKINAKTDREKAALRAPAHASTYRRAKIQLAKVQDDIREGRRPGQAKKEIAKLEAAIANFEQIFKQRKAAINKRKRPRAKRKAGASASA